MTTLRWFEAGISIALDNLQEYIETLERTLIIEKKKFEDSMDRQAADIDEEHRDEFYEYHSDEYWRLSDVFPSMLRSTVFVASYSQFEHQLVGLCEREHKRQKIKKEPNFRNRIIFSAKDYLVREAGIKLPTVMPAWDMICNYNKLRNTIVHSSGKLGKQLKAELRGFLNSSKSVSLDQFDTLQFSEHFCLEVIQQMREFFFTELLPSMPD